MKIVNLTAENIKRLKAVSITPDGNMVVISGANANGKSSVLDAIWLAVGGGAASKANTRPVRDGEDEAFVRLDLGDLIVTRKWKGGKSTLTVESADGARYSSPQAILDGLVGKLAFDPLEFASYAPAKQREVLMGLVELPFDPAELDARRKGLFEQRTEVNRRVKDLAGQVAGFVTVPASTPFEELNLEDLLKEYRDAERHNRLTFQLKQDVEMNELLVIQLREKLVQAEADLVANREALAAAPPLIDLDALQSKIANSQSINADVRELQKQENVRGAHEEAAALSKDLTTAMEQLDATKAKGLAEAVFPIKGLCFDDDGVTYNDVPFKQASSAEQLRVSTAMGMALNPQLRVMHIRDGSLLDSGNLALIGAMAEANDFQIWVERVDESGTTGVVIEDGMVKA